MRKYNTGTHRYSRIKISEEKYSAKPKSQQIDAAHLETIKSEHFFFN